jgi:hypothetical protein
MELVYAALILFAATLVWAFVKIIQMSIAFKTIEELKKARLEIERNLDLSIDSELKTLLEKWNPEN